MKYFTKCLHVEDNHSSQKWEWYNNVNNTGWESISPSDMDAIIAHGLRPAPQFRKVALFLCSRDIQVGDNVRNDIILFDIEIKDEDQLAIAKETKHFKVIGEISPQALWVKEGMEFNEDEVEPMYATGGYLIEEGKFKGKQKALTFHFKVNRDKEYMRELGLDVNDYQVVCKIKCPTCKQFH